MLREKIQTLVENSISPEEAALLVVLYLEEDAVFESGRQWMAGRRPYLGGIE